MSIGSMLTPGQAVVWRGPMATSALRQLLRETDWGGLDLLVVDLPPGTGDIQISLFQQARAGRRGDRLDAAGPGADRRAEGRRHDQAARRSRCSAWSRT